MSTFSLKVLAVLFMVIDHIGLFFFPQYIILRIIGRLSFPLFAWLIANGAHHTHNIKLYLARIFLLALISQIPFTLLLTTLHPPVFELNVVFTLFFGLCAIYIIQKTLNKWLWVLEIIFFAALAGILRTDYAAVGVLSIAAFYIFYNKKLAMIIFQALLYVALLIPIVYVQNVYGTFFLSFFYLGGSISIIEVLAIFSLVFILFYNGKEGKKIPYFFYIFYPLQFAVIYCIQFFLH